MKDIRSLPDKILWCMLFISLIAIMWCYYLLSSSNESTQNTYIRKYDLFVQFNIQENNSKESSNGYIINKTITDYSDQFLSLQNEKKINKSELSFTNQDLDYDDNKLIHENIEYNFDDIADDISIQEKTVLQEQYKDLISVIDTSYKCYPIKNILKDIVPWKKAYKENIFNSEFLYIDRIVSNANILCIPYSYGYSNITAEKIFQQQKYDDCDKNQDIVEIKPSHIKTQCQDTVGEYIIGGNSNDQVLGMNIKNYPWNRIQNNTITFYNNEFLIVKCKRFQEQAVRVLHFSEEASNRSAIITKKIEALLKIQKTKPIGIYMIMLDSVSRKHFYRNLPSTINYLNTKISQVDSNITIYDFLINNAHDYHTTANLIPILFGKSFEDHENITRNLKRANPDDNNAYKYLQERSIWKFYEKLGYVTAFDWDTMKDNFNNYIGKKVYADHTPLNFWSAASRVFEYDDFTPKQNCFGEKRHQYFVLEYLNQFNRKYEGRNRFGYFHISVGHEWWGIFIKTLDQDFIPFFEEFFNYYDNVDENFVLMISGDHGRSISEWDLSIEGLMESELPVHMLITNKGLMNKFGKGTHENLLHNTKRLVSRADWHVTLKHLALIPYGNIDISSETYENFKSESISNNSISLFLEKIPDNRVCEDVTIPKAYCSCRNYENITSEVVKLAALTVLNQTIEKINSSILKKKNSCKSIQVKEIINIESFILRYDKVFNSLQIKIIIKISDFPYIRLQFIIYAAEDLVFREMISRKKINTPIHHFEYFIENIKFLLKIQVFSVELLDTHICIYDNSVIEILYPLAQNLIKSKY